MTKTMMVLALLAAGMLSGCSSEQRKKWFGDPSRAKEDAASASRWARADTTMDQFMKDRFDCLKDSSHAYASGASYNGAGGFRQDSFIDCGMFASCLGARGYRKDPSGSLMPPEDAEIHCR